jgi:CRISPR system Cascade subunit CasD
MVVLLRLEGPVQAWAAQGKLLVRDTEREPTKSGVLGLVGAALGMSRDDDEMLKGLAGLQMGVRVDRTGTLLRDYHTAGGGRFRGQQYFVYGTPHCVPSNRYYLQDASFVVGLAGDRALATRIAEALQCPQYALFLGRRSCVPSVQPFISLEERSLAEALAGTPLADRADRAPYRTVIEVPGGAGDSRDDVPVSFAAAERRYGRRYVVTQWVSGPARNTEAGA